MKKNSDYDLSVCLAGIRKNNWSRLYNSIALSVTEKYSFELILCGPHPELPDELKNLKNVSCIQDFGSPTRAQQISMKNASGRYITWAADDGWYYPDKLAECIEELDNTLLEKKCIVTQYIEGGNDGLGGENMYYINKHRPVKSPVIPNDFVIFNCVILPTQYFKDLGGFCCEFEVCPLAFVDFGARAQFDGIYVTLKEAIFECTHTPGEVGDHGPIHRAQIDHDESIYRRIWKGKGKTIESVSVRIKLDYDNWKNAPAIWSRRFESTEWVGEGGNSRVRAIVQHDGEQAEWREEEE
jgi:hypothetical protein